MVSPPPILLGLINLKQCKDDIYLTHIIRGSYYYNITQDDASIEAYGDGLQPQHHQPVELTQVREAAKKVPPLMARPLMPPPPPSSL